MTSPAHHGSETDKLVRMANQIGDFFKSYPESTAVEGVRDHIAKFWNRKMRDDFYAYLDRQGDTELQPIVAEAVKKIRT